MTITASSHMELVILATTQPLNAKAVEQIRDIMSCVLRNAP